MTISPAPNAFQENAPPPPNDVHAFEFSGNAREYFRIWVVNLALSIVTLGVFSAWAKVRTQRYFYANTRVTGVPFEYLGRPLPILFGRIVAVTMLGAYVLAGHFSVWLQLGLGLTIALATPWLIVRGLMFRARYSSWRGLTFRFVPDYFEAVIRYAVSYLLVPLTLGLILPYLRFRQKQFVVENHRYGGERFQFHATSGDFYPIYLSAAGMLFAWGLFVGFVLMPNLHQVPPGWIAVAFQVITAVGYIGYFFVWVFLAARVGNLVYNNVALDGMRLESRLAIGPLLRLYVVNTVLILLTLGLYVPAAMVRLARYRAASLSLQARPQVLDRLVAEKQGEVGATGAEIDSVFDLDIAL